MKKVYLDVHLGDSETIERKVYIQVKESHIKKICVLLQNDN